MDCNGYTRRNLRDGTVTFSYLTRTREDEASLYNASRTHKHEFNHSFNFRTIRNNFRAIRNTCCTEPRLASRVVPYRWESCFPPPFCPNSPGLKKEVTASTESVVPYLTLCLHAAGPRASYVLICDSSIKFTRVVEINCFGGSCSLVFYGFGVFLVFLVL